MTSKKKINIWYSKLTNLISKFHDFITRIFFKKLALYFHIEDITIYSVKIPWKSFNKSTEKKPWKQSFIQTLIDDIHYTYDEVFIADIKTVCNSINEIYKIKANLSSWIIQGKIHARDPFFTTTLVIWVVTDVKDILETINNYSGLDSDKYPNF